MNDPRTETDPKIGDRRKVLAGLVAAAVAIPACATKSKDIPQSGAPVQFQLAGGGPGPGDSVLPELTPKAQIRVADRAEEHVSYAPAVPAAADRSDQRVFDVELEVAEGICPLDPAANVSTEMWGYRIGGDSDVTCGSPGPVLRGRVGVRSDPVCPGRADVPLGLHHGPLAIDGRETSFGVDDEHADHASDEAALRLEEPRYVTFNGRTDALIDDNALHMDVGERVRIYMVNEGLNLDSNFHPIGSHWDVVYPE